MKLRVEGEVLHRFAVVVDARDHDHARMLVRAMGAAALRDAATETRVYTETVEPADDDDEAGR